MDHNIPLLKDSVDELRTSADRRLGPGMFIFFLFHAMHALESILYAVNEVYDPVSRWGERTVLPTLANVPEDFLARFNHVFEGPFDEDGAIERAREFERLSDHVVELAEAESVRA